jgi:predicted TIM-barrel fold metal-dependent hydrolase
MVIDTEFYYDTQPLFGVFYDAPTVFGIGREAGVDKVVWMPQARLHPPNADMAQALQGFPEPEFFILCCTLNPQFGSETVAELERCVSEWGMRGLKLMPTLHGYPILSGVVSPVLDKARELGVVVNIHSGSFNADPLQIAVVARRYPELPFIMDHMGYRYNLQDAIVAAQECPNIYLSTTLVSPAEPLCVRGAFDEVGPERIVFGSNGPGFVDMAIEGIRRLELGHAAEELILGGNAAKVYGLA